MGLAERHALVGMVIDKNLGKFVFTISEEFFQYIMTEKEIDDFHAVSMPFVLKCIEILNSNPFYKANKEEMIYFGRFVLDRTKLCIYPEFAWAAFYNDLSETDQSELLDLGIAIANHLTDFIKGLKNKEKEVVELIRKNKEDQDFKMGGLFVPLSLEPSLIKSWKYLYERH